MLKIDLLPEYIRDRRKVVTYSIICAVIFIVILVGLGSYTLALTTQIRDTQDEVAEKKGEAQEVEKLAAVAKEAQNEAKAMDEKVEFCQDVEAQGPEIARYIEDLSKWVSARAYLNSFTLNGNQLSWAGELVVQNPAEGLSIQEYSMFRQNLERCPYFTNVSLSFGGAQPAAPAAPGKGKAPAAPTASTLGGFSYGSLPRTAGQSRIPFSVRATLVKALTLPTYAAAKAAAPAAGVSPAKMPGAGLPTGLPMRKMMEEMTPEERKEARKAMTP